MTTELLLFLGGLLVGVVALGFSLPKILHRLGLHPSYEGETHDLPGKRALIIATNHGVLNAPGESNGAATGAAASEMTHPYYGFLDGARAKAKNVVGPVNGGWTVAKRLLQHERRTDGGIEGGITGAMKETLADVVKREVGLKAGVLADPAIRQRLEAQEMETRADSIWGGTNEVQINVTAKRVLLIPE